MLKTWRSERPQERCNVCDLQYQHHQEFWTNCGKTQGFLAYSTCSLDVNLRKNAETRASNGACSSNSLLFAVYLHLWSTSAFFFFLSFLPFWSVLFAQLAEAGEDMAFSEATPLSTPKILPESFLSDHHVGVRLQLNVNITPPPQPQPHAPRVQVQRTWTQPHPTPPHEYRSIHGVCITSVCKLKEREHSPTPPHPMCTQKKYESVALLEALTPKTWLKIIASFQKLIVSQCSGEG